MNAIGDVIADLHDGEQRLADELMAVSDRHRTEHEIYHIARDLGRWSREHLQRLADIATNYGHDLNESPREPAHLLAGIRDKAAEAVGRRPEPGLARAP